MLVYYNLVYSKITHKHSNTTHSISVLGHHYGIPGENPDADVYKHMRFTFNNTYFTGVTKCMGVIHLHVLSLNQTVPLLLLLLNSPLGTTQVVDNWK